MKTSIAVVLFGAFAAGCGGGGGTGGGSGGGGGNQTCTNSHQCSGSSCVCTNDGPNKDKSCCDPDDTMCTTNKCDTFCKACK